MILLWGLLADSPLAAVHDSLQQLGISILFLDQKYISDTHIYLSIDSKLEGALLYRDQKVSLVDITSAYIRPYDFRLLPSIAGSGPNSNDWNHALYTDESLNLWADITSAYVVNRPSAMTTNNSKPYQTKLIKANGFEVPETLITTDPDEVIKFWKLHREIIYKSIGGTRSIVSKLTPHHRDRLKDVTWCPTQFQQYISGIDYRVHIVGDEVFACEISSDADDYRYAGQTGHNLIIKPYDLPEDVSNKCINLSKSLKLSVAGIDLRHDPNNGDKWFCFEVNPSPGFTYFQNHTDQPIAASIGKLLSSFEN